MGDCPASGVAISTQQFDGFSCRIGTETGPTIRVEKGKSMVDVGRNNGKLKDWLNYRMGLLNHEKEKCEEARQKGAESFRAVQHAESK